LRVLICGHVLRGGWRKKHWELGETTLGDLLLKAWRYIHITWANFFFGFFWGDLIIGALPQI